MACRSAISQRWLNLLLHLLGGLLLAACTQTTAFATEPRAVPTRVSVTSTAKPRPLSGITIVAVAQATSAPTPTRKPSATAAPNSAILQGRVYDAGAGFEHRLSQVTLEWQFMATDWQQHNGRLQIPDDGLYRLALPMRASDEVIITARAPGYSPSTAHIHGNQLSAYGSRLNFGLVSAGGAAPTLPGDLGTIQLRGIVYNAARSVKNPIAQAAVSIVHNSIVQPVSQIDVTTSMTGTFDVTLGLHTTDRLEFTITAAGYLTGTLSKNAKDLAKNSRLSIGLRPAPQTK
jgi:hypothetical protein